MPSKQIKNKKSNIKKTVSKVTSSKAQKTIKTASKKAVVKAKVVKEPVKESGLKLSVFDTKGKVVESFSLPKEIFGVVVNNQLIAQAVRVYLANQRRGTVKTKSRGEVNISTRKIYKQKGTGRARHGAASAPIFVGGGIAFGPRPRDYSLKLSKKMKKLALFCALSAKLKSSEIKLIQGLEKIEPKTKNMVDIINNLSLNEKNKKILLVTPKPGKDYENVVKASRNIEGVRVTSANLLTTYEILANKRILFMKNSIETVKETFLKDK